MPLVISKRDAISNSQSLKISSQTLSLTVKIFRDLDFNKEYQTVKYAYFKIDILHLWQSCRKLIILVTIMYHLSSNIHAK